jgi:hypothetical protein
MGENRISRLMTTGGTALGDEPRRDLFTIPEAPLATMAVLSSKRIVAPFMRVSETNRRYAATRCSRNNLLNTSARSSGKKIRAPFNSTGGFAPGIVLASQCAHFTGK